MKRRTNVISPVDSISAIVEQLQQTDATVEDGETVWVRSEETLFVYRVDSALVPDGVNVVASLYGNGVWQRLNVAPITDIAQAQTRYVDKNGNDATGNGSFDNPFLTIQAAINSITDASVAKPYAVEVAPGVYASTFKLKSGVSVVGAGAGVPEFNAAPLVGTTIVTPDPTNVLDSSFGGAGNVFGGILNCALAGALVANFALVGSTGNGVLMLDDVMTQTPITVTGSGTHDDNYVTLRDVFVNAAVDITIANMGGSNFGNVINDFGGKVVFTQSAPIQSFHVLNNSSFGGLTATWTSALLANFLSVSVTGHVTPNGSLFGGSGITLTGDGVIFTGDQTLNLVMPDSNASLQFGNATGPFTTMKGCNTGYNIIDCTPGANRNLTMARAVSFSRPTVIVIRNLSTAFFIDFTFVSGLQAANNPTYVPPGEQVVIYCNFSNASTNWMVAPYVQRGVTTLVAGVSPAIPADISPQSRIVATLKTFNGATGIIRSTGRVDGVRAGGGEFTLTATNPATGATVITDEGDYDWHVQN